MKPGSLKKQGSSKLKLTSPNNKWFNNVIKSIGYTSADIVKETLPSTFDFVSNSTRDLNDIQQQLRQDGTKSISKLMINALEKNSYVKIGKDALKNTLEDLKTGKFYNKEREEEAVLGDDFSFDDDDFSFDDDLNSGNDEYQSMVKSDDNDNNVVNLKKVTVNNINSNVTKNNPLLQSINKQSEVIVKAADSTNKINTAIATSHISFNSKLTSDMLTGISVVNDNLSSLVNFNNESMSKYVAASIKYYEDSINILSETLSLYQTSSNMKNGSNEEIKEEIDPFLAYGGLNINSYGKLLKKNMKSVIQDDLMLNSIYSAFSDDGVWKMLAASPLKAIPKAISKVVIPSLVRDSAKRFDESFANFFPALLNKFNKMSENSDNWAMSKIGQLFGFKKKRTTSIDTSMYEKGDMSFNGITQKAIVEVIPTYLRKILSALTGKNEMLFDYQKGLFIDYMKASKDSEKDYRNHALSSMDIYSELKNRLGAVEFKDKDDKKRMYDNFDEFMFKLSKSNGVNPNVLKTKSGETIDELKELYNTEYTDIFRSAILSLNSSDQLKLMGSDIFRAKDSLTRYFDDAQSKIGNSVIPVLESWKSSMDDYEEKKGEYVRKDPLHNLTKDKFGKTSIEYIREIRNLLVEGIVTYSTPVISKLSRKQSKSFNNTKDNDIINSRQKDIANIKNEEKRKKIEIYNEKTSKLKNFSDSELKSKQLKGVKVTDSVFDLNSSMSQEQMVDLFTKYAEINNDDDRINDQLNNAGGMFNKLISKGSKKVNGIKDIFDNVLSFPGRLISNTLNELDNGLYKIIFGVNKDGSNKSFFERVSISIKESFNGFFDWTKEKFFNPLHESLLGESGIITKMKNSQAMEKLKRVGRKMADMSFGKMDETGHRKNGAFSDAFNEVKDIGHSVMHEISGKEWVDRNGNKHSENQRSAFKYFNNATKTMYDNAKLYLFGNNKDNQEIYDTKLNLPTTSGVDANGKVKFSSDRMNKKLSIRNPEVLRNLVNSYNNTDLDDSNTAHGGENIFDKIKKLLSMKYSVSIKDKNGKTHEGQSGTIKAGEDVGVGGIKPKIINGFPFYSQKDPRYSKVEYGISGKGAGTDMSMYSRGCGPTAMAMVASDITGKDINPLDMANESTNTGYSVNGGTKGSFFKSIGNKLGIGVKEKQTSISKVKSALLQKTPIIFRGKKVSNANTPFTDDGHFVVGVGGKNGKVKINDPNGVETSGEYNIKDIASESNKMWTFDDTGKGTSVKKRKKFKSASRPKYVNTQPHVTDWSRDISPDGTGRINGVFNELAVGFKEAGSDMINLIFGEEDNSINQHEKIQKFEEGFRDKLPKTIAGSMLGGTAGLMTAMTGGVGILGSFFLPGGPIGGALLGGAVGLLSSTNKFKDWLFGTQDPEDTSKRVGGFISQKTQKFFKDNKTTLIGGATLGGIRGILGGSGFLPSMLFGGPITGALLGAGMGLAVRSKSFQQTIFGKEDVDGKKIGGMLSKPYNKIANNKKLIGGAGIGAIGGAATASVLSSMGIMGGLFFTGPIGGAIAGSALGIAAASDKWRDRVFGKMNDDTKKREGGLMGEIKASIIHDILTPLKDTAKKTSIDMQYWFKEKVLIPISMSFDPFKEQLKMIGESIKWKLQDIGTTVGTVFEKYVGEPVGAFLKNKIFTPLKGLVGKLYNGAEWITQHTLGLPFKALGLASTASAHMVQYTANKRKNKSEKAQTRLDELDVLRNSRKLSDKEEKLYKKLSLKRDRYHIDKDDGRLKYVETFKKERKQRIKNIRDERKTKKSELQKEIDLNKRKRRFNSIFGSTVEFDEKLLDRYDSLYKNQLGGKIRGRKNKKLAREQAAELISRVKSGSNISDKDIKDIKSNTKELSPIKELIKDSKKIFSEMHSDIKKFYKKRNNKDTGNTGSGGKVNGFRYYSQKDPAFSNSIYNISGKGENKKDTTQQTIFKALDKFDKKNDKEEEAKAKKKETKSKLSENQENVSSKNYKNISKDIKAKEEKKKEWAFKDKVIKSISDLKDKSVQHFIGWDKIFSKKGLITAGLIAASPFIFKFLKNPLSFIGDVLNKINISIEWLFGKNNESRTDVNGKDIYNSGLHDALDKAIRNKEVDIMKGKTKFSRFLLSALSKGKNKIKKTGSYLAKLGPKSIKPSRSTKDLLKTGITSVDDLVNVGWTSADDLLSAGVVSVDDLASLGINGVDDLSKIGINNIDDLTKVGFKTNSFKSKYMMKKIGLNTPQEASKIGLTKTGRILKQSPLKNKLNKVTSIVGNVGEEFSAKASQSITNNKYIKLINEWLEKFFTNNTVVKKIGKTAATKSLQEVKKKIAKCITNETMQKYSKEIAEAMAKFATRVGGGVLTAGVLTIGFSITDFIVGNVNTERLFQIPPGTADFTMKMISSLLQTALGIGMVAPLIDVANEIVAEVTGTNILSIIANIIYHAIVSDRKDLKLQDLQIEFESDYETYKKVNGLDNLSKRAYQDIVNPSAGTKFVNKAKHAGDVLTGGFFNNDNIRGVLGKDPNEKVTLNDRISTLGGNLAQAVSLNKINGDDVTRNTSNRLNRYKKSVDNALNKSKGYLHTASNKGKELFKSGVKSGKDLSLAIGHSLTGDIFNSNKIRKGLGLNDNVDLRFSDRLASFGASTLEKLSLGFADYDDSIKIIYGAQKSIVDTSKTLWNSAKTDIKNFAINTKKEIKQGAHDVNLWLGSQLGMYDEDGNPLSLTQGVSMLSGKAIRSIKSDVKKIKDGASEWWNTTNESLKLDWKNFKSGTKESIKNLDKRLGSYIGKFDEDGNPLSLSQTIVLGKDKAMKSIHDSLVSIKGEASKFFSNMKTDLGKVWTEFKDAPSKINNFLGNLFGLKDSKGNSVSLTKGISNGWDSFTKRFKHLMEITEEDVTNRNTNASGMGDGDLLNTSTIGSKGCGPTAMAMVTSKLTGKHIDPVEMSQVASKGGFSGRYGTTGNFFNYASNKYGIHSSQSPTSYGGLINALNNGQPVILRGQSNGQNTSPFTRGGHYVVAVGTNNGNDIIINDPRGEKYSGTYNVNDVLSQSNMMWSFDSISHSNNIKNYDIVTGGASNNNISGDILFKYAAEHLGKPYVWGANGPSSFDCSGLVNYVARKAGVRLPSNRPTASVWRKHCIKINQSQLKVGDLGFLVKNGKCTHVAIYAGGNRWIHAEGGNGKNGAGGRVRISDAKYLNEFGRIPGVIGSSSYSNVIPSSSKSNPFTSKLGAITGFMSEVFGTAIDNTLYGAKRDFKTFSEYMASNGNTDIKYTDDIGSVSLGSRKTTATILDSKLGGKLKGKGSSIIHYANKYGVDAAFAASIMHHESANGTSKAIMYKNNPGGIMDPSTGWSTLKSFPNLDSGIEYTISNLKRNYINEGRTTISSIGSKYAPIGAKNDPNGLNSSWVPNVTKLYNNYSSAAGDLSYGMGDGDHGIKDASYKSNNKHYNVKPPKYNVKNALDTTLDMDKYKLIELVKSNIPTEKTKDNAGIIKILNKVVDLLTNIVSNTGITNRNIEDVISSIIENSSQIGNNLVNVNNSIGNRSNSNPTHKREFKQKTMTENERRNREIAELIAAGGI